MLLAAYMQSALDAAPDVSDFFDAGLCPTGRRLA
jgi:hypothetical protein